jgi:hypothetical protein
MATKTPFAGANFIAASLGWLVFDEWRDGSRHEVVSIGMCSQPSPRVAMLKSGKACNGSGIFLRLFFVAAEKTAGAMFLSLLIERRPVRVEGWMPETQKRTSAASRDRL